MDDEASSAGATQPLERFPCLIVGATVALLFTALPRGVLLPAVDRTVPWAVGLVVQAGAFALGLAAARSVARSRRRLLLVAAATLAGGLLASALCDWLRPSLVIWLLGDSPFYGLIVAASAAVSLPLALPLGALAGIPLASGGRGAAWLLLGAAAGFVAAPILCEMLLGWSVSLQACALVGAAGAIGMARHPPRPPPAARLAPGAAVSLAVGGAATMAAYGQLDGHLDLGNLGGPWFAACACFAGSLWVRFPPPPRAIHMPLLVIAWTLLLPLLLPVEPAVWSDAHGDPRQGVLLIALIGLPAGLLLGGLLGQRSASEVRGVPLALSPLLIVVLLPLVLWRLLPTWDVRGASWALALVGVVGDWVSHRRGNHAWRQALVLLLAFGGLSLLGVGRPLPDGALPSIESWQTAEGPAAVVVDPDSGEELLAVNGAAALGRSARQRRRLAHLPLLVHGAPRSVLLSASSHGEEARAAMQHDLDSLVWIEPFSDRSAIVDTSTTGAYLVRKTGSERMLIAGRPERYDVIVMAPDPLASTRAPLVGTVEFFEVARGRLADDGLLCQWWDLFTTHITEFKAVAASAAQVFDHVYVIMDHPRSRRMQLAVIASQRPLEIDVELMENFLFEHPAIRDDLEQVGINGIMVASLIMADRGTLQLLAPQHAALRDARPVLGVRGPARALWSPTPPTAVHNTLLVRRRGALDWIAGADDDAAVAARARDIYAGWQQIIGGAAQVVAAHGRRAPSFESEASGSGSPEEYDAFIAALPDLHDWPYLDGLVLGAAHSLRKQREFDAAETYLRRAIANKPWSAPFRYALARLVEERGDAALARELYGTVVAFDAEHAEALDALRRLTSDG